MKITTQDAKIKTATVEVKVLTLSGKQVTLSVFRQLEREDLIDLDTAQFRGVPWGRVNYFWGNCVADHYHVVWQKGNELRRACVYERKDMGKWPTERYDMEMDLWVYVILLAHEGLIKPPTTKDWLLRWRYKWRGFQVEIERSRPEKGYSVDDALLDLGSEFIHSRQRAIEEIARSASHYGEGMSAEEWEREILLPMADRIRRLENEYDKRIEEIKSLDQLFIAV